MSKRHDRLILPQALSAWQGIQTSRTKSGWQKPRFGLYWTIASRKKEIGVITDILRQIFDIVYGTRVYLPETKIVLGIVLGVALLIYLKGTLGGLVASVLVSFLIAKSFFSVSNIYEISMERAVAGLVIGLIVFLTNLYFIVRTFADWRD
jgi:hypothetical protein